MDSVWPGGRLRSGSVRRINVMVSDESHEGWHRFAAEHGLTVASMLEVLGRRIDALPPDVRDQLVAEARQVAADRRRLGGPKKKPQA